MPSAPNYRIQRVNLNTLDKDSIEKLKRYTAGSIGTMVHYLRDYLKNPSEHAYAYVAIGPNSDKKMDILGWAMAHRPRPGVEYGKFMQPNQYRPNEYKEWELNIYVPTANRGRGIAQNLARHAVKHTPAKKLKVYIFSDDNRKLYKGLGVRDDHSRYRPGTKGTGTDDIGHLSQKDIDWADNRRANLMAKGTVINPETKNKIKIHTALTYDRKHPAHIAAKKMLNNL